MSDNEVLAEITIGNTSTMIGLCFVFLVMCLPFVLIPAGGFLSFGVLHFTRGWRAAWTF